MDRVLLFVFTLLLSAPALSIQQPPVGAPELRNAYASLNAVPGVADGFKVTFNDPQVLLNAITVDFQSVPDEGSCRVLVRINNLLAKVLIREPPVGISEIRQPPVAVPALTWNALLGIFGIRQPPGGIVFTPSDGLTISLESDSSGKEAACSANVLVRASVFADDLVGQITPIDPDDLRSEFISLQAGPDAPAETTLTFSEPSVLVGSFDVIPTEVPESGRCKTTARINELLARIQIQQPPGGIAGIQEPPGGIEGVTLAGVQEPPVGIVFSPNDALKVGLESELQPKDETKSKGGVCAADILVLGTVYENGQ